LEIPFLHISVKTWQATGLDTVDFHRAEFERVCWPSIQLR